MNKRKRIIRRLTVSLIGVIVTALFLYFAFKGTDLNAIKIAFVSANNSYLILLFFVYCSVLWAKALRWSIILSSVESCGTITTFPITIYGQLGNMILPSYLGEVVRTKLLRDNCNLGYSSIVSSLFLEKVLDFLALSIITSIVLLIEPSIGPIFQKVGYVLTSITIILVIVVVLVIFYNKLCNLMMTKILKLVRVPQRYIMFAEIQFESISQSFQTVKCVRSMMSLMAMSFLIWILMGLHIFAVFFAFDLQAPYSAGLIVTILIVAGILLPSTPGYWGVVQLSFTLGLVSFGIDKDVALATSLYYHITLYGIVLLASILAFVSRALFTNQRVSKPT